MHFQDLFRTVTSFPSRDGLDLVAKIIANIEETGRAYMSASEGGECTHSPIEAVKVLVK
jgi:hypothetical protein